MEQFQRYRTGDRFWYENPLNFSPAQLQSLDSLDLSSIICTTSNLDRVPPNAFLQVPAVSNLVSCTTKPGLNIGTWREISFEGNCGNPVHPENGL